MSASHEKYVRMFYGFSMLVAVLSLLSTLAFVMAQAYVRWSMNQNFTFLGGNELEVLTFSAFALLLGLNYLYRLHSKN